MTKNIIAITILLAIFSSAHCQNTKENNDEHYWRGDVYVARKFRGKYYEPELFEQDFGGTEPFKFNGTNISHNSLMVKYYLTTSRRGCYLCDVYCNQLLNLIVNNKSIKNKFDKRDHTNIILNITDNYRVYMFFTHSYISGYLKFQNLRKLNSITSQNPYYLYSDDKPQKVTGSNKPALTSVTGANNLSFKIESYKWEVLNKDGNWVEAPGENNNKDYLPENLISNNSQETEYQFRRVVTYSQSPMGKKLTYTDNTAVVKVVIKTKKSPTLICHKQICETDNSIELLFDGCISDCPYNELYNLIINDGSKDISFNNIQAGSIIKLDCTENSSNIYKIKSISNQSGDKRIDYNSGEEPSVTITKNKNVKTHSIHSRL